AACPEMAQLLRPPLGPDRLEARVRRQRRRGLGQRRCVGDVDGQRSGQHRLAHERPGSNRQHPLGRAGGSPPRATRGGGATDPMRSLPLAARIYVGAIIAAGTGLLVAVFPTHLILSHLGVLGVLVLSSIPSVFKVNLPLARRSSTMSVSYAVDF